MDDSQLQRAAKFQKDQTEEKHEETEKEIAQRGEMERADAEAALAAVEDKVLKMEQDIQMGATELLQMKASLQKESPSTRVSTTLLNLISRADRSAQEELPRAQGYIGFGRERRREHAKASRVRGEA